MDPEEKRNSLRKSSLQEQGQDQRFEPAPNPHHGPSQNTSSSHLTFVSRGQPNSKTKRTGFLKHINEFVTRKRSDSTRSVCSSNPRARNSADHKSFMGNKPPGHLGFKMGSRNRSSTLTELEGSPQVSSSRSILSVVSKSSSSMRNVISFSIRRKPKKTTLEEKILTDTETEIERESSGYEQMAVEGMKRSDENLERMAAAARKRHVEESTGDLLAKRTSAGKREDDEESELSLGFLDEDDMPDMDGFEDFIDFISEGSEGSESSGLPEWGMPLY